MKKVLFYSALLLAGLFISQAGPLLAPSLFVALAPFIKLATMFCLAYIMIGVGLEFDIDKSNVKQYGWDYAVAATAAAFPWIFCAVYFVFVMTPPDGWWAADTWKQSLLVSRFAAPTSAGVLFAMLAAAGLATTWVFKKARILAIFDDLDTVLLMIPLKILMIGLKWQLGIVVLVIAALLWIAWKYLHRVRWPVGGGALLGYAMVITLVCEAIYLGSKIIDDVVPIHLEVLLPAFVLGCLLVAPAHGGSSHQGNERVTGVITALFMIMVGLSMPAVGANTAATTSLLGGVWPGWGSIALHVLVITVLSNLGKMFSLFCYRNEATFRERLAVSVAMFPRGEVGAGVLVISLAYGIGGPAVTVAMLSLALNLVCTGIFIAIVKRLLSSVDVGQS